MSSYATDPFWGDTVLFVEPSAGDTTALDRTRRHRPALNEFAAITAGGRWKGFAGIALDGYGDYVSVPASPDWDLGTGAFTIEWMGRLDSIVRPRCLVSHWKFVDPPACAFSLRVDNGIPVVLAVCGESVVRIAAPRPVAAKAPLYIAATADGLGGLCLWVDGVPAGLAELPGPINRCPSPLTIGLEGETEFYLAGVVDAVRITRGAARDIRPRTDPFPIE